MNINGEVRGYENVKKLAKAEGCNIPDLLVLDRKNDPFFVGSPAQTEKAEWFRAIWEKFAFGEGVHLRRIHYRLVSEEGYKMMSGKPYENTKECWNDLQVASACARAMGLVPAEKFIDKRNPDPHIFFKGDPDRIYHNRPSVEIPEMDHWSLPAIKTDLSWDLNYSIPDPEVWGYDYADMDQPYHLEIWIEKSTQDDVLLPICRKLKINLVTSIGFQSITSTIDLLCRVAKTKKPARIFYISDFDPAGDAMPVSVARQIEFYLPDYAPGADIRLEPIALTKEQVKAYKLPRIFIKESDLRKGNFEDRHGEGAVELDALEALHKGELARIVEERAIQYRDLDLEDRLQEAENEAYNQVCNDWGETIVGEREELEAISEEAGEIVEKYREELTAINGRLQNELEPLKERLKSVRQAVQIEREDKEQELNIFLPPRPDPETDPESEDGWLFSSKRDYLEQLTIYKIRQRGND